MHAGRRVAATIEHADDTPVIAFHVMNDMELMTGAARVVVPVARRTPVRRTIIGARLQGCKSGGCAEQQCCAVFHGLDFGFHAVLLSWIVVDFGVSVCALRVGGMDEKMESLHCLASWILRSSMSCWSCTDA